MRCAGIAAGNGNLGHAHIRFGQKGTAPLQAQIIHVSDRRYRKIAVEQPLDLTT